MALSAIALLVLASANTESLQHEGTEFIFAFCEHKNGRSVPSVNVINYNNDPVLISISIPGVPGLLKSCTHVVKTVVSLKLPKDAIQQFTSIKHLAVHITSNDSIVVNGFNTAHLSIGGFLALPVSELGTEYITVNHCQTNVCIIMIAGILNQTLVRVHLNSGAGNVRLLGVLYKSGDNMSLHLNRFGTIQLQSTSDLSGTRIHSNHPIAVFVGSDYTIADFGEGSTGEDNFVEQLIPVDALGTFYLVPSLFGKIKRDFELKIVAPHCDTKIKISNGSEFVVSKGSYLTKRLSPNMTYTVGASARILVVVIINSWGYYKVPGDQIDGSICILQPVDIVDIATKSSNTLRLRIMKPVGNTDVNTISLLMISFIKNTARPTTRWMTITKKQSVPDLPLNSLIYSGIVWLTGEKTGAMFGMLVKHIPNEDIKRETCHNNQWVDVLSRRNISQIALLNDIRSFREVCCI